MGKNSENDEFRIGLLVGSIRVVEIKEKIFLQVLKRYMKNNKIIIVTKNLHAHAIGWHIFILDFSKVGRPQSL